MLLEAMRGVDARLVVVGFGPYRAELEALAPPRTLFTGPLEHRHLVHLLPLADVTVVPSIFPEAFGMVAAEAAAAGSPPLVARHSGLAEVAAGLEEEYPERFRHLASFETRRRAPTSRRKLSEILALSARRPRRAPRRAARQAVVERWSWASVARACSLAAGLTRTATLPPMGEEQRDLLAGAPREVARAAFEAGTDFTVAVEEEFALLDPDSLELTDRFEELYAAAIETDLAPNVVGELIASEVEVRTGRCENFGEAAAAMAGAPRASSTRVARELQIGLGGTGTHPWSRWQDQRIIDTPHYRRNDELLRYVVWRNNTFGLHVHVGIAGADRAIAVHDALRNFLPELLALSASSPFVEDVNSGLHSARTEIFTRMFPRCGIPDAYGSWQGWEDYVAFLYRDRLDHRAHADLVERPPAPRLPDDRDPDLRRPARPRRGAVARGALLRARRSLRPRATTRASRCPTCRTGCSRRTCGGRSATASPASCSTSSAASRSPRARRLEQLLEWVAPGRRRDRRRAVPRDPGAERRRAPDRPVRGGRDACEEIYAEQVQAGEPVGG